MSMVCGADACNPLQFDLDAIDDFTKAIEFDREDSNNYFMTEWSARRQNEN